MRSCRFLVAGTRPKLIVKCVKTLLRISECLTCCVTIFPAQCWCQSAAREKMYRGTASIYQPHLAGSLLSILEVGGGPPFTNYLRYNQTILCSFLFVRFCMHEDCSRGVQIIEIIKLQEDDIFMQTSFGYDTRSEAN